MFRDNEVAVLNTVGDSVDTFKHLLDLIYGNTDALNGCQDWGVLFEIVKLADKYDVKVEIPNVSSKKICVEMKMTFK